MIALLGERRHPLVSLALMGVMATLLAACMSHPVLVGQPDRSPGNAPVAGSTDSRFADAAVRVGLLLPLTGRGADIGAALGNAARMALDTTNTANFELLIRDTASTPEGASAAAADVLAQGAELIIGPLFGENVPPVAQAAAAVGVNLITFSSDPANAGNNVYLFSFLAQDQVDRVVGFAIGRGVTSFAGLLPQTTYGEVVGSALQSAVPRRAGTLSYVGYYPAQADDYSGPVQAMIAAAGPVDAVMLPDGGLRLRQVAPLLPYYGLERVQMLGTGLWDGAGIQIEQSLQGAWFAAPDPSFRAAFNAQYEALFGSRAPRLTTLAHDAVSLAVRLPQQRGPTAFSAESLTDPAGFTGVDGIFRFRANGLVERGLAVLEVTPDGDSVVDPAPRTFAGPIF